MIQNEITGYEERLKELRAKEAEAKGPFEEDVGAIPDAFLCQRVPLSADVAEIQVTERWRRLPEHLASCDSGKALG